MLENDKKLFKKMNDLKENNKEEFIRIRNNLVEKNLKLVLSRVQHIYGKQDDDLIQAGNEALIFAVSKFDVDKGFEFSTYAVYWIDQAIHREIAKKNNWGSIPIHKYDSIKSAIKKLSKYKQDPTVEELSLETGIEKDEVIQILNTISTPVSLNTNPDDSDSELFEVIDDGALSIDEYVEKKMLNHYIMELLKKKLNRQEFAVIVERYGLIDGFPKTLEQISSNFKITRERVRQVEIKAIKKLRNSVDINHFSVYLDNPDAYIYTKKK